MFVPKDSIEMGMDILVTIYLVKKLSRNVSSFIKLTKF
jgi:hypothetical protein